ncbi:hypothetical protein fugu_011058 [Takifugu bimaculatus]|nr:hypothetical protein fugu_011058 [Takifugu bimaculatus]
MKIRFRRVAESTVNDALWDEIRCRQRGAEENGCGSANGRVRHAAEGRGGRRSSRQGAALTSLHAYCGNLFKKQLDAASPNSHTSPAGSEPRERAGKERLEDQVRGMGAAVHASLFASISRSARSSAEIHLSCDFLFHIYGGHRRHRRPLATMTDRKAVIKNADMSEDMQQDAVDCATQAMEKYNIEKDIAAFIKKEFDKKYNPTWHCIVGRNFGSYVTHETKHFIYFYLGQVAILLFKSG